MDRVPRGSVAGEDIVVVVADVDIIVEVELDEAIAVDCSVFVACCVLRRSELEIECWKPIARSMQVQTAYSIQISRTSEQVNKRKDTQMTKECAEKMSKKDELRCRVSLLRYLCALEPDEGGLAILDNL